MLQLFNVATHELAPRAPEQSYEAELQNVLARLGALHLHESADVLLSERLDTVERVVRETLIEAESPRLITALAPVLVRHADKLRAQKLAPMGAADARYVRRLRWLLDNTVAALTSEPLAPLPRAWAKLYARAQVKLLSLSEELEAPHADPPEVRATAPFDVLDAHIRSKRSLEETVAEASPISKRWRVATSIQTADFTAALQGARDAA